MPRADRGIVLTQLDRLFNEGTLTGLGEAQLLERYRTRRDELAFETLVNRHGPMVLALCRRMLHDPRDIEDAFQATFLILVRKAPSIRDGALLSNWLYGVAHRVAARARQVSLRRRARETSIDSSTHPAAPELMVNEFHPALDEELARLPDKYRVPLVLCYLNGKTHHQAAELLSCPVGTIHSRINRARLILRTRLTRRGLSPTASLIGTNSTWSSPFSPESVPPALVVATVNAALDMASSQAIKTGLIAASVLSLTQGAVTTMNLTTIKWASLGLLATAVSAGSVVALGYAAAPGVENQPGVHRLVARLDQPTSRPQETAKKAIPDGPQFVQVSTDDQLAKSEPTNDQAEVLPFDQPPGQSLSISNPTISELVTRLEIALDNFDVVYPRVKEGRIDVDKFLAIRAEALLAAARLKSLEEQLVEEESQIESQRVRKNKKLDDANRQKEVLVSTIARTIKRQKGETLPAAQVYASDIKFNRALSQITVIKNELDRLSQRSDQNRRLQNKIAEDFQPFRTRVEAVRTSYGMGKQPRNSAPDALNRPASPSAVLLPPADSGLPTPNLALKLTQSKLPEMTTSNHTEPSALSHPADALRDLAVPGPASATNLQIRLLELPLERELDDLNRKDTAVTTVQRTETCKRIRDITAVLTSLAEDLDEEITRLQLERKLKQFDVKLAAARKDLQVSNVSVQQTNLDAKIISKLSFAGVLVDRDAAEAQQQTAVAQLEQVNLKISHLANKKERLARLIARSMKAVGDDTRHAKQ